MSRDVLEYDAVIVGAGPAGLACAIRLKQLKPDINICVLEKGATVGAHSLSGAVIEPGPLDALLPEWRKSPPGICVPATRDEFRLLTRTGSIRLPTRPHLNNHGNLIVSLGLLTAWLGQQAENLGVDVFPGFAAAAPLFDEHGAVAGVQIGDMGLDEVRRARTQLLGRSGSARTADIHRRRRPRQSRQGPDPALCAGCQIRTADLRTGHEGAVAGAQGPRRTGPDSAHRRLAAGYGHLRRQLHLSPGPGSRVRGLRGRPGLLGSELHALRSLPAVQEPSRASVRCSRAARFWPPARAPSPPAAGSRFRSWRCPAPC